MHKRKSPLDYFRTLTGAITVLLNGAKNRAKKRDIMCDLTHAELVDLFNRQQGLCAISGIPFDLSRPIRNKMNPFAPSIDKIDLTKGYTFNNVRFVLTIVNIGMNTFGDKVFIDFAKQYIANKKYN
jgi:hypothetical protein